MKSSSGKNISNLERRIRGLLDAASGALGSNRTLALVFAVHIVVLVLVLFGAALFTPKPEIIEPVPVVMEPMPEQAAAPAPQPQPEAPKPPVPAPAPAPEPEPEKAKPEPKPVVPPPPEPEEIVEKKKPEPKKVVRKKIVKPAPAPLPEIKTDENLKARLKSSLSKISPAPAPQAAGPAAAQTAASGQDTAVNVAGGQFPYNWYLGLVQAKISANWDKPSGMLMSDSTVSCVASFRIRRDGKVTDVGIARSSGNAILDDSALAAIRACDPMPPLPERFSGAYIDIRINFNLVK